MNRRLTMKTIITLLATTMLVAGATSAMALDRQATDDALDYATSVQASRGFGGAFASAVPGEVRNSTVNVPSQYDFQMDGR
jgi:O-glycosyl hydrolase